MTPSINIALPVCLVDNINTCFCLDLHGCKLGLNHSASILLDNHPLIHLVFSELGNYLIILNHQHMNNLCDKNIVFKIMNVSYKLH